MQKITTSFTKTVAISALLFIATTTQIFAATFPVSNANNSGPGSLRQAVLDSNNAPGSDTIVFDQAAFSTPQTITLLNAIFVAPATGESLTITGPGASLLTIRGNGATDGSGLIFNRNPNTSHGLSLSGMTLTDAVGPAVPNYFSGPQSSLTVTNVAFVANANGFGGGGIANAATLTVTGCTFTDNVTSPSGGGSGSNGGGAINSDTNDVTVPVTITGSTFTGNLAGSTFAGNGGAVNNRSGAMTITNSTFTNNRARNGGGAIANGGVLTISGSTISGNSTTATGVHGGAISSITIGQLTITDSLITQNTATGQGGGIYTAFGGTTNITRSTISANTAQFYSGGGLYLRVDSGAVNISGSSISGNFADVPGQGGLNDGGGEGGGIWSGATLTIENSTISTNAADGNGGGIYADGHSLTLSGVTLVGNWGSSNSSESTGGIYNQATFITIRNSIFANNWGFAARELRGHFSSEGYNLIEDPSQWQGANALFITGNTATNITGLDPNLGPLQDNGGPTFTHAPLAGSPAVDQGKSFVLTTDQRGQPRPHDMPAFPNASGGDGADIGAYEVQAIAVLAAVSRKMHGSAGTFDVPLPLTGEPGVECRSSGGNHTLIITFTNPLASGSADVTSGVGTVTGTPTLNGSTMTVNLTGVADVQKITVSINNVTDSFGQALPNTAVSINMLIGDINANKSVTASDLGQVKAASGIPLSSTNFRADVAVSGGITASDIGLVKSRSGQSVP